MDWTSSMWLGVVVARLVKHLVDFRRFVSIGAATRPEMSKVGRINMSRSHFCRVGSNVQGSGKCRSEVGRTAVLCRIYTKWLMDAIALGQHCVNRTWTVSQTLKCLLMASEHSPRMTGRDRTTTETMVHRCTSLVAGKIRPDSAANAVRGRIRSWSSVEMKTKIVLEAGFAVAAVVGNSSNFDFLECREWRRRNINNNTLDIWYFTLDAILQRKASSFPSRRPWQRIGSLSACNFVLVMWFAALLSDLALLNRIQMITNRFAPRRLVCKRLMNN